MTDQTKHTPGPWHTGTPYFGRYNIYSDHTVGGKKCIQGRQSICISHYEGKNGSAAYHEMFVANARLIAAAPENFACNLELAKIVRELCGVYGHPLPEASLARSDAAIAKATGSAV